MESPTNTPRLQSGPHRACARGRCDHRRRSQRRRAVRARGGRLQHQPVLPRGPLCLTAARRRQGQARPGERAHADQRHSRVHRRTGAWRGCPSAAARDICRRGCRNRWARRRDVPPRRTAHHPGAARSAGSGRVVGAGCGTAGADRGDQRPAGGTRTPPAAAGGDCGVAGHRCSPLLLRPVDCGDDPAVPELLPRLHRHRCRSHRPVPRDRGLRTGLSRCGRRHTAGHRADLSAVLDSRPAGWRSDLGGLSRWPLHRAVAACRGFPPRPLGAGSEDLR